MRVVYALVHVLVIWLWEVLWLNAIRALVTRAKGPRSRQLVHWLFPKTLSFHPAANGYLALFRAGEGEGGEEEE